MFKKTTITIAISKDKLQRTMMRCFKMASGHLIVLGDDYDDHDVWQVVDRTIELVGTFTKEGLKQARECGLSKKIKFGPKEFTFLQPCYRDLEFDGKRVTMSSIEGEYTYHEVCKCGKHQDQPVEPCSCKLKFPIKSKT